MRIASLIALAAVSLGIAVGAEGARLTGVAGAPALHCRGAAQAMARLEMIFGMSRSDGRPITDEEWTSFLDSEVTPRFPAGLTVLHGPGQWRGSEGLIAKEESNMLIIWHEPTRGTDADIEAIRTAYKNRFGQESVMRVDGASCVSF